ncbi:MBL fold metallo-hydrolase [Rufibacter quisquiliarum]|uniref:L-ascorbate metabolism protein UlaG (Beta-lactamase superfamily) n=1 Tax=Rufibacter quisquiliarum TaxID=1549639 RepID=A0A839GQG6_9BACT|nr:MBL fold metallo-hydrolase [Rufibacter quisquiliarum]MBA9077755.1 L-ascorbate metabolism protein UlaG (beta-lactamase superfamily) [Rufibacter quisquiliarum]
MTIQKYFVCLLLLLAGTAQAQQLAPAEKIETKKGTLTVQPILHASLALQWDNKTIYVDPTGGAKAFAGMTDPDLILITDIHGDHLDLKTLEALNTSKARIIAPQAVVNQLPESMKAKAVVLTNGEKTTQLSIPITAVPMYNLPETADSRHPKGRGNGYVLEMGGKRIYLSGDTEDIPEMRSLKDIDVAFVCMNLPYTMDINQAAAAVLAFKPNVVIPYHYRGQNGLSDVAAFKQLVADGKKKIEVRLLQWYPEK